VSTVFQEAIEKFGRSKYLLVMVAHYTHLLRGSVQKEAVYLMRAEVWPLRRTSLSASLVVVVMTAWRRAAVDCRS
jgi:hypothetical protein